MAADALIEWFDGLIEERTVAESNERRINVPESSPVAYRAGDAVATFVKDFRGCPLGKGIVIEVQHKNLGKDKAATTRDYHADGYSVVWTDALLDYDPREGPKFDREELKERAVSPWPHAVPEPGEWSGFEFDLSRYHRPWEFKLPYLRKESLLDQLYGGDGGVPWGELTYSPDMDVILPMEHYRDVADTFYDRLLETDPKPSRFSGLDRLSLRFHVRSRYGDRSPYERDRESETTEESDSGPDGSQPLRKVPDPEHWRSPLSYPISDGPRDDAPHTDERDVILPMGYYRDLAVSVRDENRQARSLSEKDHPVPVSVPDHADVKATDLRSLNRSANCTHCYDHDGEIILIVSDPSKATSECAKTLCEQCFERTILDNEDVYQGLIESGTLPDDFEREI